jgi:hypothetical protein
MIVHWCTQSGGVCSIGRVSSIVNVATHDVCPGCAGLMDGLAQQACGAGVANLDLISVCPAVPDFVPSRFGVAPVRGVDTGFCHWGRSHWCGRGSDAGGTHLCDQELDVSKGFVEHCISSHQVLDGGVLFNGCLCQIVERRSHLLCLFEFGGLICAKRCVAVSHAIDVVHFYKGSGTMGLPVGLSVVDRWATFPLASGPWHFTAR